MQNKWKNIHESDTANGNPTCWALEIYPIIKSDFAK